MDWIAVDFFTCDLTKKDTLTKIKEAIINRKLIKPPHIRKTIIERLKKTLVLYE